MIGDVRGEINFPQKSLLNNRQPIRLRKSFANNSSAKMKLSKTQISKIKQLSGFLRRLLGRLMKIGSPSTKNVMKPLAKSNLILLGLTVAAANAAIYKKNSQFGNNNIANFKQRNERSHKKSYRS